MNNIIIENIEELKQMCKSLDIKRMYAFGSVLNESFSSNSDIDLLIAFDVFSLYGLIEEESHEFFA